jgi:hypothetical protein
MDRVLAGTKYSPSIRVALKDTLGSRIGKPCPDGGRPLIISGSCTGIQVSAQGSIPGAGPSGHSERSVRSDVSDSSGMRKAVSAKP